MDFPKARMDEVPLDHQTVLLRADYNVPLRADGSIGDDRRIRATVPTIRALIDRGCRVVIISHLGRPKGQRDARWSLLPVAERLADYLGHTIKFVDEALGDKVRQTVRHMRPGTVALLENLRFYPGEETDDPEFARRLVHDTGARYLVQDGFGVAHRAHASTRAITLVVPAVAGRVLEREYTMIMSTLLKPTHPFVAIMGGAKMSDKVPVIERLIAVADHILIGGALAHAFLAYRGYAIGRSLIEPGQGAAIEAIYAAAARKVGQGQVDQLLVLPRDVAVAPPDATGPATRRVVGIDAVGEHDAIVDIGEQTIDDFTTIIASARTILWNGPLGRSEVAAFAHGSARVALALATNQQATSVIGGGDTADFIAQWDGCRGDSFSHLSTGGGASLVLLAEGHLVGVDCLLDARPAMRYTKSRANHK